MEMNDFKLEGDDIKNLMVQVSCGHCDKLCSTLIKDENSNVLIFITSTVCEYCGEILAKYDYSDLKD